MADALRDAVVPVDRSLKFGVTKQRFQAGLPLPLVGIALLVTALSQLVVPLFQNTPEKLPAEFQRKLKNSLLKLSKIRKIFVVKFNIN